MSLNNLINYTKINKSEFIPKFKSVINFYNRYFKRQTLQKYVKY